MATQAAQRSEDRRRSGRLAAWSVLSLAALLFTALFACRGPSPRVPPPESLESLEAPGTASLSAAEADYSSPLDAPLTADQVGWVEATLASMTPEQKAAQLMFVRAFGRFRHRSSAERRHLLSEIRDLEVGGIVLFASELETIPRLLNELQEAAPVPLLIASDLERGLSFRVRRSTTPIPYAMAVGATRSEEAARASGEITAREARAVGIHWALAPVLDVNNNPQNPIINLRSYGEEPELVARLGTAFIDGVRDGGVLTSAKHFPGHGDTAEDSHLKRPALPVDRERLEAVELVPFRRAIESGVDSIMLAHLSVPALDPSGAPATLSPAIADQLLRDEMGYEGLIVTDALEMAGVRPAWTGEAAVKAFAAGADVLLLPTDTGVAVDALVRALRDGRISEERLDASVRRLLVAKARMGLASRRAVDPRVMFEEVARPEDLARARGIARDSITVVRNDGVRSDGVRSDGVRSDGARSDGARSDGARHGGPLLPLRAEQPLRLLHLVMSSDARDDNIRGLVEAELRARQVRTTTVRLGPELSEATARRLLEEAPQHTHVLVSAYVRVASSKGSVEMAPAQAELIQELVRRDVPVIVASFGSPYLLSQFPEVPAYLCAYGSAESSQRATVAALFGETDVVGKLPVTLPGLYAYGHGLEIPRRSMDLSTASPKAADRPAEALAEVDRTLAEFVERKAFPGGVLAVGHEGELLKLHPFGHLSYEPDAPEVRADTIYDLASLTKVVATTTMAMILVDRGLLDLDKPVVDFLPGFRDAGPSTYSKKRVKVRHLLTHTSGIDWWAPLYEDTRGPEQYLTKILAMELVSEPGTEVKYSDLGIILLGQILERVAGEPLDRFVERRVFRPLGMDDTTFRPGAELRERIAPTELDSEWRGRMLRGEVHDENAFALGGVAPHAGLFSTASDLAQFAQMLLNGGVLKHRRIVSRETVDLFTRLASNGAPEGSTRALGWDTRSAKGSSSGRFFSFQSFGHTGFTGTSMWMDPERDLFIILLTNRVHPTRDNPLIRQARPAVADAVIRGLGLGPVHTGLDRVTSGDPELRALLAGKRLGLVAHRASVTRDGRHAIEALRGAEGEGAAAGGGFELARLFSPEHGLAGTAAAGEKVGDGRHAGLPLVSLYGERRKPSPEDLEDLDALVFDLQGAGVRFYTYASTLLLALEAAAETGIELIVLDRPNPLGGERVAGPVSAPRDVVPESFLNMAPGPLVHGLTLGEMARFANRRRPQPARLTVVPMTGWSRGMTWEDTGLPWVPPSPNLRTPEAALAYPGVALLEATTVSEGRGTEIPFLRFGAPWLDTESLERRLKEEGLGTEEAGFSMTRAVLNPRPSPAAPRPRFADQQIPGFEIGVLDPDHAEPYRLGVSLLYALIGEPGFDWREGEGADQGGAALVRLLGTPTLLDALRAGKSVDDILTADRADHERWRQERRDALLY